ncbi:hypothetical protein B4589_007740 [Halolamina sp. CBA1230]|uniref:hypothetical protein n=1 Tax=Halolamina sp. CBA1230 TaxID=1853690 RepID=UPI0009A221E2|nr:hypothetical protein [Halolamina sp. CBA1230]QKY20276.1 hypothetical protein B4589_007740 [Halolamina sp. CBA1230]
MEKVNLLVYAVELYVVAFLISGGLFVAGVGVNPLYILALSVLLVYLLETQVNWPELFQRLRDTVSKEP